MSYQLIDLCDSRACQRIHSYLPSIYTNYRALPIFMDCSNNLARKSKLSCHDFFGTRLHTVYRASVLGCESRYQTSNAILIGQWVWVGGVIGVCNEMAVCL